MPGLIKHESYTDNAGGKLQFVLYTIRDYSVIKV